MNPFVMRRKDAKKLVRRLSPRQFEVICLMILGYSHKQIAGMMTVSEKTVTAHLFVARNKLQAQNMSQATAIVIVSGMAPVVEK